MTARAALEQECTVLEQTLCRKQRELAALLKDRWDKAKTEEERQRWHRELTAVEISMVRTPAEEAL